MNALIIIDVQIGILTGPPAVHDVPGLLGHIHALIERARHAGALVVYVQHDGPPAHRTAIGSPGWPLDPSLKPRPEELVVHNNATLNGFGGAKTHDLRVRPSELISFAHSGA